jgi:hypothetical protein
MTHVSVANREAPRKQLSDQLDRLDVILDTLSEGLNQAVAEAAREGTRLAVRDTVIEIMTDPTLRAQLQGTSAFAPSAEPAPPVKKSGFWARLKAKVSQTVAAVGQATGGFVTRAVGCVQSVVESAAKGLRAVQRLGMLKKLTLVGVGAGVGVGVASFVAPHAVSAAVAGIAGVVAAAVIQVGVWTRCAFRALTLA